MAFEAQSTPSEIAASVIRLALAQARIQPDDQPAAYIGAWRRAAALEAVESLPARPSYALSPRSTRGATRA